MNQIVGVVGRRHSGGWDLEVELVDGAIRFGAGRTFTEALCHAMGVHPDDANTIDEAAL